MLVSLLSDADRRVCGAAVRGLGRIGADPKVAVAALMGFLSTPNAPFDQARLDAIRGLGAFGKDAAPAVQTLITEMTTPRQQIFGSYSFEYGCQRACPRTLGRIGPAARAALPLLHATDAELESYRGDWFDERAAELLIEGKCETEDEARVLMSKHPGWRVRRAAVSWFRDEDAAKDPKWTPMLLAAIDDPDGLVQIVAIETLLRAGLERDACYRALLRDGDPMRWSAWTNVQIMWRYELDPKPLIPQLERERDRGKDNPAVYQNLQHMIDEVKAGITHKDGRF